MNLAIVGGGVAGCALAYFASRGGARVTLFDRHSEPGGCHRPTPCGDVVWDRSTHHLARGDRRLTDLLAELGLSERVRWRKIARGYALSGEIHRVGASAAKLDPPLTTRKERRLLIRALGGVGAEGTLSERCGKELWERFCRPVLDARFRDPDDPSDREAAEAVRDALQIDATRDLELGYVEGGARVLVEALLREAAREGCEVRLGDEVDSVTRRRDRSLIVESGRAASTFDRVVATVTGGEADARAEPVQLSLLLKGRLTPFFETIVAPSNDGGGDVHLRAIVEATNLVESKYETSGKTLVHLRGSIAVEAPRHSNEEVIDALFDRGLVELFPGLARRDLLALRVDRCTGGAPTWPETEAETIEEPVFVRVRSSSSWTGSIGEEIERAAETWHALSSAGNARSPLDRGGVET